MEYPEKIAGFRSKAINAIIDAGRASRPVAGDGIHVSESSAGSAISLAPGFSAARPFPFMARLVTAMADGDSVPAVQVWPGRVLLPDGTAAEFDAAGSGLTARADPVSGLSCVEIPAAGVSAVWLNLFPYGSPPRYTLGTSADGTAAASLKVAEIAAGGNVVQRLAGDVALALPLDFAWKATLAPVLGSGGVPTGSATVSFRLPLLFDMVGGQTNSALSSSITVSDSARICARVRTVTSSGGIAMLATLHAAPVSGTDPSPPADGETDYPVAQANRSGDAQSGYSWRLTQLQLGAIHVLHLVDEEV